MFEESNPWVFREILERLPTPVYVVDRTRKIVFWNDEAERLSGYLRQEVLGRFCRDNLLEHCDADSRLLCHCECPLAGVLRDGQPREAHMYLKHRNGQRLPVLARAVALHDSEGGIAGAIESFDLQIAEPTVGNLPHPSCDEIDQLTGLSTAWFVLSYLQKRTAATDKEFRPFTVLHIALSHFPELLRRYGATAGAGLVRNVAQALRSALKPSDVLGRWGDCQFVVVLDLIEEHSLDKLRTRLQTALEGARLEWWGDSITVKVAIDERILERSEDKQSVLSWLGPPSPQEPRAMHAAIHTLYCAREEDD